jgi:hypothetical protein
MQCISLDDLYKKYSAGELNKKEFEGRIFNHILNNYQQFHLSDWSRDVCIDYLCGLYPRLTLAIDGYKNVGSSFENYIKSKLYWFVKEHRTRESDHHVTEYACWETWTMDRNALLCDTESEYLETPRISRRFSNPRQILILLLKSYAFVSEEFITRAAPSIGIEVKKLQKMIDDLRKKRFERDDKIRRLLEQVYSQYYRCVAFERRMRAVPEDSAFYEIMKGRLERARKRYVSMRKRLASVRFEATNRQIAEVLGIPKGTVDSSLYAIKQKYKGI